MEHDFPIITEIQISLVMLFTSMKVSGLKCSTGCPENVSPGNGPDLNPLDLFSFNHLLFLGLHRPVF